MGQLSGLDYSGKVVLVTGGTKGIGAGIARSFLEAGAQVIVCGRTAPEALPQAGSAQAIFMACDVRDVESLKALFAGIAADFGRLDVVINNAGGSPSADAGSASPRFHEGIIRLNLIAPLNVAQQANVLMQQQDGGGCIVFIGSISALRASPGTAAYGAAKAGVLALTRCSALEAAENGVRINAVAPSIALHDFLKKASSNELLEQLTSREAFGRAAEVWEVANVMVFLASDYASYMVGEVLPVSSQQA